MKQRIYFSKNLPDTSTIRQLTDIYVSAVKEYSIFNYNYDKLLKQLSTVITNVNTITVIVSDTDKNRDRVIAGLIASKLTVFTNQTLRPVILDILENNNMTVNQLYYIDVLAVVSAYRNKGIGTDMFTLLLNNLKVKYGSGMLITVLPYTLEDVAFMFDFIKREDAYTVKEIKGDTVKFNLFYKVF